MTKNDLRPPYREMFNWDGYDPLEFRDMYLGAYTSYGSDAPLSEDPNALAAFLRERENMTGTDAEIIWPCQRQMMHELAMASKDFGLDFALKYCVSKSDLWELSGKRELQREIELLATKVISKTGFRNEAMQVERCNVDWQQIENFIIEYIEKYI